MGKLHGHIRTKSIRKNYLIDCCIKENGIDNDPHVQQKTLVVFIMFHKI